MVTLFSQKPSPLSEVGLVPVAGANTAATSQNPGSLSAFMKTFLAKEQLVISASESVENTIKVSEVLGKLAFLYERIRNIIEYKGEHVLRRNAIERILKRLFREYGKSEPQRIAQTLTRELIWARYLKNDTIPKSRVKTVAGVLNKYIYFTDKLHSGTHPQPNSINAWVWGIASVEIEETLDRSIRENLVELMYGWFTTYFAWADTHISEHEKSVQIYLAVHRAFGKSDEEIMRYHMLIKEVPMWKQANEQVVADLIAKFPQVYSEIEKHLFFPDRFHLYRVIKHYVAPFEIFRQLATESGNELESIFADQRQFHEKIQEICAAKYTQVQSKVRRGIVRSIVYIFVTKVLFALLVEVPYDYYRFGHLAYIPIGINTVVPPALMWLVGLTIKAPGGDNTERILQKLKSIVYHESGVRKTTFSIIPVARNSVLSSIFSIIYLVLALVVGGGLTLILLSLRFSWVGILIFFAFLSLVLLFGFRVKYTASELKITSDQDGILGLFLGNLSIPFLRMGVYLSRGLARINFFTVIFDFLIEAPLKTIIEVIEEWTSFMREKQEDAVEVPE